MEIRNIELEGSSIQLKRQKGINALFNYTYIENSLFELDSPLNQLESSLIE